MALLKRKHDKPTGLNKASSALEDALFALFSFSVVFTSVVVVRHAHI